MNVLTLGRQCLRLVTSVSFLSTVHFNQAGYVRSEDVKGEFLNLNYWH